MTENRLLAEDLELFDLVSLNGAFEHGLYDARFFSVHEHELSVRSNSLHILNSIEFPLSFFRVPRTPTKVDIDFLLLRSSPENLPIIEELRKNGELLFDSAKEAKTAVSQATGIPFKYYVWKNLRLADFDSHGVLVWEVDRAIVRGLFPNPDSIHPLIFSSYIFSLVFSELLRSRGSFLMHAATVAVEGRGVIIPAYTGSGKTTLALALCRGGFSFLSDDRSMIRMVEETTQILAFPEGVDVTEQTLSFFPELNSLTPEHFAAGLRKKKFWIEDLYPGRIVRRCIPKILLFPIISNTKKSFLKTLPKIQAIRKILPHSLVVMDQQIADLHFNALCKLVESTDCYHIHFGSDFSEVHQLVRDVM